MPNYKDLYERWAESGKLDKKLNKIRVLAITDSLKDISSYLGITTQTLRNLKKKHPPLASALNPLQEFKAEWIQNIMKLANGQTVKLQEANQYKNKKGQDKTMYKFREVYYPPNLEANIYCLSKFVDLKFKINAEEVEARINNIVDKKNEKWEGKKNETNSNEESK